jgi:hypothetical protein
MKRIIWYVRSASILLALLILFHGCSLYKGSITLEEAVASRKRVKVSTSENPKPLEFKRIELVNGEYKGLPNRYDHSGEKIINKEGITEIKEYDKTASDVVTFAPIMIIIGMGILLFSGSSDGDGY